MKTYAICSKLGDVLRTVTAETPPEPAMQDAVVREITGEQAALITAGRQAKPIVIYAFVDDQLLPLNQAISARIAKREADRIAAMTPEQRAIATLAAAERTGIELPFGGGTINLLCGDRDRALFASALTLYSTYEDLLPSEEAKAAFRSSNVTLADADGAVHTISVTQARHLLVAYGAAYQQLWAAAAAARAAGS